MIALGDRLEQEPGETERRIVLLFAMLTGGGEKHQSCRIQLWIRIDTAAELGAVAVRPLVIDQGNFEGPSGLAGLGHHRHSHTG
jgi:hypothetical protein